MPRSADFATRLAVARTGKDLLGALLDIARAGADRYRSDGPYDLYELLAIEIISDVETMPHVEARKSIANRLRILHGEVLK